MALPYSGQDLHSDWPDDPDASFLDEINQLVYICGFFPTLFSEGFRPDVGIYDNLHVT